MQAWVTFAPPSSTIKLFMSHVLVTGASGFLGGVLKRRLLREGHTVVNIDLEPDAESFVFDTDRIKQRLGGQPTLTNEEMLLRSYEYYTSNCTEIRARTNVSTHRKPASMGIIRLLKWIS